VVWRGLLLTCFGEQWEKIRKEEAGEEEEEVWKEDHVEVHVSEVDRDPYGIMISKGKP
jgi:hypothetical protein